MNHSFPSLPSSSLLAEYYETIADWVLPHVVERPLSLVRCPSGQDKQCFFQRHAGAGVPDTILEVPVQEKRQRRNYLMIRDLAGLIRSEEQPSELQSLMRKSYAVFCLKKKTT